MLRFVLVIFCMLASFALFAQQDHFLYLQSEDRQPFYARISNQVYSSSENGYLIVPKLADGAYQVDIGFARSAFPEQHFAVQVNKKDQGFQLKNLGQKGWGLYSLRNGELLENKVANQSLAEFSGKKKTDAFSAMLANVVNDSAILYSAVKATPPAPAKPKAETVAAADPQATKQPVTSLPNEDSAKASSAKSEQRPVDSSRQDIAKTEVRKEELTRPAGVTPLPPVVDTPSVAKTETPVSGNTVTTTPPATGTSSASNAPAEKPFITKISEATTSEAYSVVYLEQYNLSTDTVRIIIPVKEETMLTSSSASASAPLVGTTAQNRTEAQPSTPVIKTETTPSTKKPTLQVMNSDCKNFASDFDVDKLRVKLMAEYAIEDKLLAAKKVFKQRCFTVKQIRALTELFPSDETKYQFFDAAYPFVSDTSDFYQLEELLKNDYFRNRFKAMINK